MITHAGMDDRVVGLVYLAALAPDEGESSQAQQDKFARTAVFDYIEVADGRIWLLPEGTRYFCGDLSEEEQKLVWATAMAPAADVFARPYPGAAWKAKPSWYVVAVSGRALVDRTPRRSGHQLFVSTRKVWDEKTHPGQARLGLGKDSGPVVLDADHRPGAFLGPSQSVLGPGHVIELAVGVVVEDQQP